MEKKLRIGIDFDNTIICYDDVFCHLAKSLQLVSSDYSGTKRQLRNKICALPKGDIIWQQMQGKVYGQFIQHAYLFQGFKEFMIACHLNTAVEVFIVSHKTEFGHFDENRIDLRHAARCWLRDQGLLGHLSPSIGENNVFFELTREEKIERIKLLQCTHFIDDLIEVFESPTFPSHIERILFEPSLEIPLETNTIKSYSTWAEIKNAIFHA